MNKLESIIIENAKDSFTWVGEVSMFTNKNGQDEVRIKKAIMNMVGRGILIENKSESGYANTYELSDKARKHFKLLGLKEGARQLSTLEGF